MPNRFIKESICKSETLHQLSAEEERLFYRLIVNCDDFGRFYANPAIVRNSCFCLDDGSIKIDKVDKWLLKLADVNLITLYVNNGKPYLQFVTWGEHQQSRATKSKFPSPDDSELITVDNSCYQSLSNVSEFCKGCSAPNTNTNTNTNTKSNKGGMGGKQKYAEFVSLTNDEYSSLVAKVGEIGAKRCIEILDNYKGQNGKKYKSDYRAILNWVIERHEQEKAKGGKESGNPFFDLLKEEGKL